MKKLLIPILFLMPLSAFAANPPLSVQFVPNPLFSASNFMPGDNKEANITVGNSGSALQNAYIEAVNVSNSDNLASQMKLEMFDGSTPIYNNNFGTFLNAGPVSLSSIGAGGSKIYNLKITFLGNAGDSYQGKTLKFDICVGFSGGDQHCTSDMVIGPEDNSGSGGGGSGAGSMHLVIYNDRNDTPQTQSVVVRWETNKPATSQVIYGPAENNYTLDSNNLPFFGYPSGTNEDFVKAINHTITLTGLTVGQTYKYRVVSRASPPTISYEHEFTVPLPSGAENVITAGVGATGAGEILGANSDPSADGNATSSENVLRNNLAAAFGAGWSGLFSWWWLWLLIILLAVYLLWRFVFRKE